METIKKLLKNSWKILRWIDESPLLDVFCVFVIVCILGIVLTIF